MANAAGKRMLRAARQGDEALMRTLAEAGANLRCANAKGMGILGLAAREGRLECLRLALALGASPSCKDRRGCSPLMAAASRGHVDWPIY